jgi:hypothetical protein
MLQVTELADQLPNCILQTLSGIPGVQLRLEWVGGIEDPNHPCITQWLKQYGQLISHLIVWVHVSEDRLKLKDFSTAAAPCRSIELEIRHPSHQVIDLADLNPVAGSLHDLICRSCDVEPGSLIGTSTFNSMSQLTAL